MRASIRRRESGGVESPFRFRHHIRRQRTFLNGPDILSQVSRILGADDSRVEARVRDGKAQYLKRIRPYRASDGHIDGVVITFTDISNVAMAREQEKERRENLERVTRDLQDFAYAVSHDLHKPLRQIRDCVARLVESLPGDQNADIQRHMGLADSRIESMQQMLDCLLAYSRVNTEGDAIVDSNLDLILDEVLATHQREIHTREAVITREPLPVARCAPKQLQTVLWHLIDNALKYISDRTPNIHIYGEVDGDRCRIVVRDNGLGIKESHRRDIFVIFRRLGFVEGVAGNGVGLALCSRIMERLGGQISVQSEEGVGSKFILDLPLASS